MRGETARKPGVTVGWEEQEGAPSWVVRAVDGQQQQQQKSEPLAVSRRRLMAGRSADLPKVRIYRRTILDEAQITDLM